MDWENENFLPEEEKTSWTEADWEKFFDEQEKRAEHYQKKFEEAYNKYKEQYTDDEELSKKIQSDLNQGHPVVNSHWLELAQEAADELDRMEPWEKEEQELEYQLGKVDLDSLPAYQLSFQYALNVPHFIRHLSDKGIDTPEIHQLHLHCYQIAAHIAGGHALGYDKDGLTGNIVKLKRALKSSNLCLEALLAIKRKHLSDENIIERLVQDNILIRDNIIHHIEELRKQVWW